MLRLRSLSDKNILQRIRENDRTALGEIFLRYERMIFSHIVSHGGSGAEAEDILQEAIIVLWQKVTSGEFTLTSGLGTYLMGIAKNKWRAELRKRKKFSSQEIDVNVWDGNPSSLQLIISEEQVARIQDALNKIEPVCRKVLLLFYFEEKSMEEIATIMGFTNTDVAKSRKYQCKKILEEILKGIEI
ncbi:MAG: sigma-70 family RNA polymerase sigma factor [Calditrichaeota bacterium]|nr:sigma-70 family RNA polymerase sigma factor [Calditrichota bacterium]RQV93150.1 MAG: sigma-70 family RNA polymerase sigma factor [bacterium]RQW04558.1 MAG: sigma-70 family RNA polymerase sigma factor [Calditrichota bacterium]